ncbi:NAD(P)H-binding protein [Nonomuraea africana]|uniref:NAD(P)H-binding protein n=1 Tax=Nonomuraea africana TaxID=46171 RepID=UPI0033C71D86
MPIAILRLLLAQPYADQRRMEEIVRASDLDWTIVRLNRLLDGPATGGTRVSPALLPKPTGTTRADVATTLLDILLDETTYRAELNTAGPLKSRGVRPQPR